MKYLKIFTDFAEEITALDDAEVGRLFLAMLSYAASGESPALTGCERYLWGAAKKHIDNQRRTYEDRVQSIEKAREHCRTRKAEEAGPDQAEIRGDSPDISADRTETSENRTDIRADQNRKGLESGEDKEKEKEKEKEKDKDKDKEKGKEGKSTRFVPPTLEEVRAWCAERGSDVDPLRFFSYYDAGQWIDARGQPVRSWKQKLISWEKNGSPGGTGPVLNRTAQELEESYAMMRRWADGQA